MSQIRLIAHLPRFRMEPDQYEFSLGSLVKLTWESYDSLTRGAFNDWKARYEAADPVFLHLAGDVDLPFVGPGSVSRMAMTELKIPSLQWYGLAPVIFGTDFLTRFHDGVVDTVWAALMLACPATGVGWPRTSVTMLLPEEGEVVHLGDHRMLGLRVQGEADQEYVYSADTACRPVSEADLYRAASMIDVVQRIRDDGRLGPCLGALLSTVDSTLTPGDRLVLAVTALEGLLLPEVRTGQQDALAAAVTTLLGADAEPIARQLYRARSKSVHGGPAAMPADVAPGAAEQLLADVILALSGEPPPPDRSLRGMAPADRLMPRPAWWSGTSTSGVELGRDGQWVSWSPLVGLVYEGGEMATPCGTALAPMSVAEIVSMEEKDIRRDFIAPLVQRERDPDNTPPPPLAAVVAAIPAPNHPATPDEASMARLLRARDLTTVGLRIAGFEDFVDPELLGWYLYDGAVRHRRETVLRQTVLMGVSSGNHRLLTDHDLRTAGRVWAALGAYGQQPPVAEIDDMLHLYRRAHDPYASAQTHLTLLFALLESMLGQFRSPGNRTQLEDLVAAVPGAAPEAVAWFAEHGRRTRNAGAHGAWRPADGDVELAHLRSVCGAVMLQLLEVWTSAPRQSQPPGRLLVRHLSGGAA